MAKRSINEILDNHAAEIEPWEIHGISEALREMRAVAKDFLEADQEDGSISYWQDRFFELTDEKWDEHD